MHRDIHSQIAPNAVIIGTRLLYYLLRDLYVEEKRKSIISDILVTISLFPKVFLSKSLVNLPNEVCKVY